MSVWQLLLEAPEIQKQPPWSAVHPTVAAIFFFHRVRIFFSSVVGSEERQ